MSTSCSNIGDVFADDPVSADHSSTLSAVERLTLRDDLLRKFYREAGRPHLAQVLACVGLDVVYHRANGARLEYLRDGRPVEVLDFLAGYGAGFLGHNHPELVAIAKASLEDELPSLAQASTRGWASVLCNEVNRVLSGSVDRDYVVHLLNTGSEVVEAAVRHCALAHRTRLDAVTQRIDRKWRAALEELTTSDKTTLRRFIDSASNSDPQFSNLKDLDDIANLAAARNQDLTFSQPRYVALEGSYHGSSTAASQLSWGQQSGAYKSLTGIDVSFVSARHPRLLEQVIEENMATLFVPVRERSGTWSLGNVSVSQVAGLFVEAIQGEGGIIELHSEDLQRLSEICRRHHIPVVADEVQTGLGRTGSLFACSDVGLQPEIMLLSKVLGGGMVKIAAMAVAREEYIDDFSLQHSSTFAEDDPSSRIALGVLEIIQRNDCSLIRRTEELGCEIKKRLERLRERWPSVIHEIRGRGLMLGIEFASMSSNCSPAIRGFDSSGALLAIASGWLLHQAGVRVAPALRHPRTMRLQPPVVIDLPDIDLAIAALERLCAILARGDVVALTSHLHGEAKESLSPSDQSFSSPRDEANLPTNDLLLSRLSRDSTSRPRIAFLTHFIDVESARDWEPQLASLSDDGIEQMLRRLQGWVSHFPIQDFRVRSVTGAEVDCLIYGWPVLPDGFMAALRDRGTHARLLADIRLAIVEAYDAGCGWVGFGGFTSILTRSCLMVRNTKNRVTSGNSLTAAMAYRAVLRAARDVGLNPKQETVGIVGAAGNLGSVQAHLLKSKFGRVKLFGRPGSGEKLERVAVELTEKAPGSGRVETATELRSLVDCSVIVTASNATEPLLQAKHLSNSPIVVLDVSVPGDVDPAVLEQRPAALYIRGGVVKLPHGGEPSHLRLPGWHLPEGHVYGCLAETLLLGLENLDLDYSCGAVSPDRVFKIMALADKHGFELGGYQTKRSL